MNHLPALLFGCFSASLLFEPQLVNAPVDKSKRIEAFRVGLHQLHIYLRRLLEGRGSLVAMLSPDDDLVDRKQTGQQLYRVALQFVAAHHALLEAGVHQCQFLETALQLEDSFPRADSLLSVVGCNQHVANGHPRFHVDDDESSWQRVGAQRVLYATSPVDARQ